LEAWAGEAPKPAPDWLNGQYEDYNISIFKDDSGNVFIPGSYFRRSIEVDLDRDRQADILLGECGGFDPRIEKLGEFAKTFREAADKKNWRAPEDVQIYLRAHLKYDVSIEEARIIQGDNLIKKEAFYAKTFHKQIHDVFGDYNEDTSLIINKESELGLKMMKELKVKRNGELDMAALSKVVEETKELYKQRKTTNRDSEGIEHIADIGKGEDQDEPVCRHYAPVMSKMLDIVGIENCAFLCNQGGHATVASLRTGNVFETTTKAAENCYKYSLIAQKPGDLLDMKQTFYFVDRTGCISSIDFKKGFTADGLQEKILTIRGVGQQAKKVGYGKFGEMIAQAQENGTEVSSLPVMQELKSMPEKKKAKLLPEEKRCLDALRKFERSFSGGENHSPKHFTPGETNPVDFGKQHSACLPSALPNMKASQVYL